MYVCMYVYLYVQASTPYDELLHSVDVLGTCVTVNLERSAGYSGPTEVYIIQCSQHSVVVIYYTTVRLINDSLSLVNFLVFRFVL